MLGHVFQGKRLPVFGEAEKGVQQCRVEINIIASVAVEPGRRCRAVDCMLDFFILLKGQVKICDYYSSMLNLP